MQVSSPGIAPRSIVSATTFFEDHFAKENSFFRCFDRIRHRGQGNRFGIVHCSIAPDFDRLADEDGEDNGSISLAEIGDEVMLSLKKLCNF